MAYATTSDVQSRITRTLSSDEMEVCANMLDDVAVYIDAVAKDATCAAKKIVSCNMVIRALGDGSTNGIPLGATQGSQSGLGYSQSWTISGGASGEWYLSKRDRTLLGLSNSIGSYSPVQELAPKRSGAST